MNTWANISVMRTKSKDRNYLWDTFTQSVRVPAADVIKGPRIFNQSEKLNFSWIFVCCLCFLDSLTRSSRNHIKPSSGRTLSLSLIELTRRVGRLQLWLRCLRLSVFSSCLLRPNSLFFMRVPSLSDEHKLPSLNKKVFYTNKISHCRRTFEHLTSGHVALRRLCLSPVPSSATFTFWAELCTSVNNKSLTAASALIPNTQK